MFNGLSQKINKDVLFIALQNKNPLKVRLSEGHIFKALIIIGF
jgi:hypothetical protein